MTRINSSMVEKSVRLLPFLLIFGVWALFQLPQIKIDNSIDVWLDHHSREYQDYLEFQSEHGSDEWILIAFPIHDLSPKEREAEIKKITERLSTIEKGIKVISITSFEANISEELRHILLSEDQKTTGILLLLSNAEGIGNRQGLVRAVKNALSPYSRRYSFHLGGPTLLNAEMDRISERQARIFFSLAFLITLVGLYVALRSFFYLFVAVGSSGMPVLWTLGIAAKSGMDLNMITTVLPVLLWVLSLTGSIHFIHHLRLRYQENNSLDQAVSRTLQSMFTPYLVAGLTTGAGFLSLLLSHMQPVRDLGLYAAIGIGLGFLSNLVLLPGIILFLGKRNVFNLRLGSPFLGDSVLSPSLFRQWKGSISTGGSMVLVLAIFFIPSLKVESNVLTFFDSDSQLSKDYQFISRNLSGLSTIEIDFRGQQEDCLDYAYELNEELRDIPEIKPVIYPAEEYVRMSIFVQAMESMYFNRLVQEIKSRMELIEVEGVRTRLTGTVVLLNSIQEELIHTQIKSFSLAILTIVLLLGVTFRSLKIVLIGSIVNLFPIAVLLGIMAVFHIPLNVATVMVAGVTIGIAVDDTVFFLTRLRSELAEERDWDVAIDRTFLHMVKPLTFTSLITASGFFALLPADFTPLFFFGLLGGITMISAWIGDLIILPALLHLSHPTFRRTLG